MRNPVEGHDAQPHHVSRMLPLGEVWCSNYYGTHACRQNDISDPEGVGSEATEEWVGLGKVVNDIAPLELSNGKQGFSRVVV